MFWHLLQALLTSLRFSFFFIMQALDLEPPLFFFVPLPDSYRLSLARLFLVTVGNQMDNQRTKEWGIQHRAESAALAIALNLV